MIQENIKSKMCSIFLSIFLLLAAVLANPVFGLQSSGGMEKASQIIEPKKEANISAIQQVCAAISKGNFAAAEEIIKTTPNEFKTAPAAELPGIVVKYDEMDKKRQIEREAAFEEQLVQLEKLRTGSDKKDPNSAKKDVNDIKDSNDPNDANDVHTPLSVITKACEFADKNQKEKLLKDPYVKQSIDEAIKKAAELESNGKWIDSYISCYSWLQVMDPNNKVYSEHGKQLLEKAEIEASFQDSPCETRDERYLGVKKEMLYQAIEALKASYVSVLDYRSMAAKGIKRSGLLAEVVAKSPEEKEEPNKTSENETAKEKKASSLKISIEDDELAAWSSGLSAIMADVNQSPIGIGEDKFVDTFEKVLQLNKVTVELPEEVLIVHFSEAALEALDNYTVMVWPKQMEDFEKLMTNEFTGIGIHISKEKGQLTAASLLPDTPAYNSGLDAGDTIEKVDGIDTKDMSLGCAVKNITGPAGTKVTLTVKRAGEEKSRDITIVRARITVPTINGWKRTAEGKWQYMIDENSKIGYVKITSFSERTAADFEGVLRRLEAEGLKGLIVDLRFNSGGLLKSATDIVDKFIDKGLIVSTRPRVGAWTWEYAKNENTHPNYPLVILINGYSASASEIVAGALADSAYNRATLVGERTYGKGSVQGIIRYQNDKAELKYTMAYYYLPSGQRVESQEKMKIQNRKDWGVAANVEVKLRSDELKKMSEISWDNNILAKAGHDSATKPLKKHTAEETLGADPQLAVGVLVIKSKLIQAGSKALAAN